MALYNQCYIFRCTGCDDLSACISSFRPEIDDMVCRLDHIQIMLYHNDGILLFYEVIKDGYEFTYVMKVQTCRRLVEEIDSLTRGSLRKFPCDLVLPPPRVSLHSAQV